MIVWLLLLVLEIGPTVPLEIFPNTAEGRESCDAAALGVRDLIKNASDLKCERYQLTAVAPVEFQ